MENIRRLKSVKRVRRSIDQVRNIKLARSIDQVRRVEYRDESIGMGFNIDTGLAVGTALENFSVKSDPIAPGQQVSASITIVNTHDQLMEQLGMSFEAQGRYGFFSASAKASFSSSTNFNSSSTFVVAKCIVKNPFQRGDNFHVKQEAQDLLNSHNVEGFKKAYGDSFVRGLQTGGEFYAVIRITSISQSMQTKLGVTLQAEMNGLVASGGFQAEYNKSMESESTRSEYSATMFQRAGTGADISPVVEISDLIERYKNFPGIALKSAFPYETEIATYDTLPLPIPTPEEQADFLLALHDAQDKKLNYIQKKNDLEFARKNPVFFEGLPTDEVLLKDINDYTKLINAVMEHGIKLSRGEMNPPRYFDPSTLSPPINEPVPIQLKRVKPGILVPDLVKYSGIDLAGAMECIRKGTVDDCLAGRVESEPEEGMPNINVSREVADFLNLVELGELKLTLVPSDVFDSWSTADDHCPTEQHPSAGTLVTSGSEIILTFKEC